MSDFLHIINNPCKTSSRLLEQLRASCLNNKQISSGAFALCIAGTETSDIDGISAAGATAAHCRLTPAADAEALILGHLACGKNIPVSPSGVVSPVVLTRASLQFLDCRTKVFDCGSFIKPQVDHTIVGTMPGRVTTNGQALDLSTAQSLFDQGLRYGSLLANQACYLTIAECVPGGTTTALGILTALGHYVDGLVSGSIVKTDSGLKAKVVNKGLQKSGLSTQQFLDNPLAAVSAVGDPMQPFAAGMALAASQNIPVILGGGSQMLAVYALICAIERANLFKRGDQPIAVVTTNWVAYDKQADTKRLSEIVMAPCVATNLDISKSRHPGLRAYERGHVKEGVGAGAAMALAHLCADASESSLLNMIDQAYDQLVFGVTPSSPAKPAAATLSG